MEVKKVEADSMRKMDVDFDIDAPMTNKDTTIDEELLYSTEDIQDIYDDTRESRKELMKKKAKMKK